MAGGRSSGMPTSSISTFIAMMIRTGSCSVVDTHSANRIGTWSKVRIQPTAALPMITSMTMPVATPASIMAS